jgi:hypothetical protein
MREFMRKRLWFKVCLLLAVAAFVLLAPTKRMKAGATDCYLAYEECYANCNGDDPCEQNCQITYQSCDASSGEEGGSCPSCGPNCARVAAGIMSNCRNYGYVPTMYQSMYNTCRANGGSGSGNPVDGRPRLLALARESS